MASVGCVKSNPALGRAIEEWARLAIPESAPIALVLGNSTLNSNGALKTRRPVVNWARRDHIEGHMDS